MESVLTNDEEVENATFFVKRAIMLRGPPDVSSKSE
jgi:hypothetical protein